MTARRTTTIQLPMTLRCQKHLFSLPDDLHYVNCAYMSPLSRAVEAAGIAGIRRKCVPSTVTAADFFTDTDEVRALFASLIGVADPQRIAVIPSVSYGIATVANNLPLDRGQNIVVLHEQFPSNIYTWRRLHQQSGVALRSIAPPDTSPHRGLEWNARIERAIDENTAMVAIPHVHWADGTRFDLARIGHRARQVGAVFVIDGTQSVGALPFDVQALQPDALICAGYKWLLGPYSIGVAYYGPRFDDGIPIEENWITRQRSEDFAGLVQYRDAYQPGAIRYDVGERSNFALLPMLAAGLRHLHDWGVANIQAYIDELTHDLLDRARQLGFWIEDRAWRGAHLFGVRVPDSLSIDRLRTALAERQISVSLRGNAVRIAPHVYNDKSDMDALLDAFEHCTS